MLVGMGSNKETVITPVDDGGDGDWTGMATETSLVLPIAQSVDRRTPSIVVMAGAMLGKIYELEGRPLRVGRDPGNTVMLEDTGVSRHHVVLERLGDRTVLRDLGSKNGTYVNDIGVQECVLKDGDLIFVGQTTFKYLSGDTMEQGYYESLHRISVQDPLTSLPNRRYFDEVLDRECARAKRHGRSLVLLLLDVDHFKAVNDTYGHVTGDMVLYAFAQLIRGRLRRSEFMARYGGEEFALVLPEADLEGAILFAEIIRERVEAHIFRCAEHTLRLTVSVGGALWGEGMESAADLLRAADGKLYEAKNKGRNRVAM